MQEMRDILTPPQQAVIEDFGAIPEVKQVEAIAPRKKKEQTAQDIERRRQKNGQICDMLKANPGMTSSEAMQRLGITPDDLR